MSVTKVLSTLNFIRKPFQKLPSSLCLPLIALLTSPALQSAQSDIDLIENSTTHVLSKQSCRSKPGCCNKENLTYYLYISDFIDSFVGLDPATLTTPTSTIASSFLAGRAPVYNTADIKVGTCSASFLNMQNADGIYTDISNYFSVDSGLIVSWFTPTRLVNLLLDSVVHSMVTECIVTASTKIGVNPFYGKTFNLVVSSDNGRIYFQFTRR